MDFTQEILDELVPRLENDTIPDAPKHDANRILAAISPQMDAVISDGGYEDFVLSHLDDEVRRFGADPEDLGDDEEPRTEPLCGCDRRYCDLKEGELPVDIRTASSLSAGIREFKATHRGTPHVLDEAHEAYREDVALVRQAILDAIHILSNETRALAAGIDPEEYGLDESKLAPVPEDERLDADGAEAGV